MNDTHARSILTWRYDPPYDLYDPGAGNAEETVRVFLNPEYAYHAILAVDGALVAFCCFGVDAQVQGGAYGADALDIGLGVRPDLTGQGQGSVYVQAVLDFAGRTYASPAFRVTVAAFNERALRVWERAGFQRVGQFQRDRDGRSFVVLVREKARPE
jgi:RimJ/RimL family protein N-acetyltransferase